MAITHNVNLAVQYSDQTLLLGGQNTYECGPTKQILTTKRMEDVFRCHMQAAKVGTATFFMPLGKHAVDSRPPGNATQQP